MNGLFKQISLKPRWRKVFSDLWGDRTRTGLVVASIAVGVFAIGTIISSYVILGTDINLSYAAVNPPNIEIWTDPFDKDLVQALEKVPGVEDVEGRRLIAIRGRKGNENWKQLNLIGVPDFNGNINHLVPIEGTQYPGDDQVTVSQNLLSVSGFHTGDIIEIEMPDGLKHTVTVVGLVTDQTTADPDPGAANNVFITFKTLRSFGLGSDFNHLYITVDGDGANRKIIATVAAEIQDQIEKSGRIVHKMDEKLSNLHPMTDPILAVIGILGALGILITVLSSSLIINTLNALLTQQLRQIGVMKLIGARSYQILFMYLTLIFAYCLIALAISVPLGAIAGYGLALLVTTLMGAGLQGFRIVPAAIITQILIATLIPLGAGYFPVHGGSKTSVQEAISNYHPRSQPAKGNFFSIKSKLFDWIPRPILLSFRNTFRKRARLVLTIFTLTVAGAVFIGVFNVRDSMGHMMDQLMQHFKGDVTVTLSQPYTISKVDRALREIPGVKGIEAWGGVNGEIWDENDDLVTKVNISAPPQDTQLLNPEFVSGRWLLPGEQKAIVISDTIYKSFPNLKAGDSLIIKLPGQNEEKWVVVGIFRFVNMLGDPFAYANFDFISHKMHTPDEATSFLITSDAHDRSSQKQLTKTVDDFLGDRNYLVQSVDAQYSMRENVTKALNILVIFLLIMAILTAFVGSIGLTGTMSINVLERTREIGVMRTIGAVDKVIMQSVIIESLVIGLITWVLSIGLLIPHQYLFVEDRWRGYDGFSHGLEL